MVTAELLSRYEIFGNVPEKIAHEILEHAEIAPYAPGEVIVSRGQPFTFFGVLLEGEACAYLGEEQGKPRSIESMSEGGFFGEMALMTGLASPVDVIATAPTRLLLIPVGVFTRWVQVDPAALQVFSKSIARKSSLIEHQQLVLEGEVAKEEADEDPYGLSLTPEEPQKILVLNLRTGSLKYRFFDTDDREQQCGGSGRMDRPAALPADAHHSPGRVFLRIGHRRPPRGPPGRAGPA